MNKKKVKLKISHHIKRSYKMKATKRHLLDYKKNFARIACTKRGIETPPYTNFNKQLFKIRMNTDDKKYLCKNCIKILEKQTTKLDCLKNCSPPLCDAMFKRSCKVWFAWHELKIDKENKKDSCEK